MYPDVEPVVQRLPGFRQFMWDLLDDLHAGRSVIVVVPARAPTAILWNALVEPLVYQTRPFLDLEVIDVTGTAAAPPQLLLEALGLDPDPAAGDQATLKIVAAAPAVVALRGLDQLPPDALGQWRAFCREWAAAAMALSQEQYRPPSALAALWPVPVVEPPQDDAWLRTYAWWSVLSDLDVRVLCRDLGGVGYRGGTTEDAWREAVLPALAGNDLALVSALWDVVSRSREEIFGALLAAARDYDWSASALSKWGLADYLRRSKAKRQSFQRTPMAKEKELWARGLLDQTPEYGIQVSPVALAALGEWHMLEHLLWRGQAALLLPILDELRLSICTELTNKYGPDWAWQWAKPLTDGEQRDARRDPLTSEWGHLKAAIAKSPVAGERGRWPIVALAWELRNHLAHYEAVEFADYARLMGSLT